ITDKFYGSGTFTLDATTTSGLPISYSSSNTNIATVSGNVVTLTGVGSVTITASQAGDDVFNAATDAQRTFIVNKGNQTISFSTLAAKAYGSGTFNLGATASSNLAVSYVSSNTAVATVSGSTVTIVGVGTTDITASQAGDANYNAATDVVRTLTVTKGTQVVTVNAIAAKKFGDAPFTVDGTSTTGGPLSFTSSNTNVATISGNTVTIVGAGNTTITADQAGNDTYNPGSGAVLLSVAKAEQTITFSAIPAKAVGDAPFTVTVTSSSGLPVTLTGSSNIEVSGNVVTITGHGSASLNAYQGGNTNYYLKEVSHVFCISPAKPVVTITNLDTEAPTLEAPSGSLFYRWLKDGVEVGTANIQFATEPGVYTLVTHKDGCESVPSDPISIVITGTEETADAGVKVYPNPVVNELVVDVTSLHETTPVRVELHDAAGRTIHSEMATRKAIVKMEKQKPGLYLLKIQGSRNVITKQIIKK
ncbi:MAG TPA: T9SS type A sorting domain-containing protein, partial [Sphingobacteriaceae bacterium]